MRRHTSATVALLLLACLSGCQSTHAPPPVVQVTELRQAYVFTLNRLDDLARAHKLSASQGHVIRQTIPVIDAALDAAERSAMSGASNFNTALSTAGAALSRLAEVRIAAEKPVPATPTPPAIPATGASP